MKGTELPSDLSMAAIKAARRLQSLPNNRIYAIILIKRDDRWELSISDEKGSKIDRQLISSL